MPLFGPSFNGPKLKVLLKLCITRLQMLQKKKDNQGVLARKEIAGLLGKNKEELARIRVEQIIRDDYIVEVLEILELYCTLLTSRFGLIEAVKDCDPGLLESVQTLMWVAPRLQAEVSELKQIAQSFGLRYGKDFIQCAMNNEELIVTMEGGKAHKTSAGTNSGRVSERVMHKLTDYSPKASLVDNYLVAIAQTYGVDYIPPIRAPEGDLLGGGANSSASAPALINFPSAPLGAASGGALPRTDFPGGDFPPPPGGGGGGGGGAFLIPPTNGAGNNVDVSNFSNLFPSPPGNASVGSALYPPPQGGGNVALYPPQQGGGGGGGPDLSYLPSVEHHQMPPPHAEGGGGGAGRGGDGLGRNESEAPLSYDESESFHMNGGGAGVAPTGGGGGMSAAEQKEREAYGADVTGYAGNTEPMYAEVDASNGADGRVAGNGTYASYSGPADGGASDAPPDFDELARRFQNLRERSDE